MKDVQINTSNITDLRSFLINMVEQGKTEEMIDMVLNLIVKLKDENVQQAHLIRWLQTKPYRSSSEVVNYLQRSLFGDDPQEPETPEASSEPDPPAKPKPVKRGKRQELPADLPRIEHIIEVPDDQKICPECRGIKTVIGFETSETLDYVPGHFEVHVHKREKCVCKVCEEGMVVAPPANKLIEKGIPGIGLITEIIIGKYNDHLPLYRLEKRFARLGVSLARSSMSSWIQTVVESLLSPLADRLRDKVLNAYLTQSDDTTIKVLDRDHPKNIRLGYFWFYTGDHKYAFIDFRPGRSREGPIDILKSRATGYLLTDGYAGYERLYNGEEANLTNIGCWMHARRYFYKAYDQNDLRAFPVLEMIKELYRIDREAGSDESERLKRRQTESKAVIDKLKQWLEENHSQFPPLSLMGKATTYLSNQWESLTQFLNDGKLPLDNGEVERAIRPVAVGRKNYLFAGSKRGAQNAAVIYSLLSTCELNDVNPYDYFKDILDKLANNWPANQIDDLLPDRWKERNAPSTDE